MRAARGLLRLAFAAATATVAIASAAAAPEKEPLEPELAFPLTGRLVSDARGVPRRVELRFAIHDGYYLYADRFKVDAPGLAVGRLSVPAGTMKDDPFVGKSRIVRGRATLGVPLPERPAPGDYTLTVTAQGCAENRVCYAPFSQPVRIVVP